MASSKNRLPFTMYRDTPRVDKLRAPLSKMYLGMAYAISAGSNLILQPMEKPFTHKPGSLKQSLLGKSAVANVPTPSNIMPLS